jgi:hypothetical protein
MVLECLHSRWLVFYKISYFCRLALRAYTQEPNEDIKRRNRSRLYSLRYSSNRLNTLFRLTKGIPCSMDPSSCIYFSPLLSTFVFSCFISFPSSFLHICSFSLHFLHAHPFFISSNFLFDFLPAWSPCFPHPTVHCFPPFRLPLFLSLHNLSDLYIFFRFSTYTFPLLTTRLATHNTKAVLLSSLPLRCYWVKPQTASVRTGLWTGIRYRNLPNAKK